MCFWFRVRGSWNTCVNTCIMTITVFLVVIIEKFLEYSRDVLLYRLSRTNVLLIEYVKIYKGTWNTLE